MDFRYILEYKGCDNFNQPVFKAKGHKMFIGSTEILVPDSSLGLVDEKSICEYFHKNMDKLEYFGNHFNCEPMGTKLKTYRLVIKGYENIDTMENIHFAFMGGDVTVYDVNKHDNQTNDYKVIAFINTDDRTVKLKDETLTEAEKVYVYHYSLFRHPNVSATQEEKVFKTEPLTNITVKEYNEKVKDFITNN